MATKGATKKKRKIAWKPNPGPQTAFLACPVPEILFGGAKGGGKSEAIGPLALKHVKTYGQWSTVLILRETYPQLRELMKRMRPHCLRAGGKYNKTDKTWIFPSGAEIIFGHLSDGCDPYWGQEYSLIIVDEITRTIKSEQDYLMLLGSSRNSHGVPCRVVLTSNPGGMGHNWVKARFLNVPPLTVQRDHETGLERVFIPASLKNTPQLGPEYLARLMQMGEKERKAYIDGDWSAFEGEIFKLEQGVHVWTWAEFKARTGHARPPKEWTRFRSMDWGYAKPFAIYWYAVDYEGRAYVYREWYGIAKDSKGQFIPNEGARLEPTKVADKIASVEKEAGEAVATGWTGPDLDQEVRGDHGGGKKLVSHFTEKGVRWTYWTASAGSRIAGKMALHERLHYERGEDGEILEWPGLIFISEECPHALRTVPALEYDEHQPEQVDTDGEDHAYDSLSGFCKMKPWKPVKPKDEEESWLEKARKKSKGDGSWMSR